MAAGALDFVIDQGEDWTAQGQLLDYTNTPIPLVNPGRMDIKDELGGSALSLVTEDNPDPDSIPSMAISGDIGLVQLHIPADITGSLVPGEYNYDMFLTQNDEDAYAGNQVIRVIVGKIVVRKRITEAF